MTSAAISSSIAICTEMPRNQRRPHSARRLSPGGALLPPHPPSSRGGLRGPPNRRQPAAPRFGRGAEGLRTAAGPALPPAGAGAADADLGPPAASALRSVEARENIQGIERVKEEHWARPRARGERAAYQRRPGKRSSEKTRSANRRRSVRPTAASPAAI